MMTVNVFNDKLVLLSSKCQWKWHSDATVLKNKLVLLFVNEIDILIAIVFKCKLLLLSNNDTIILYYYQWQTQN